MKNLVRAWPMLIACLAPLASAQTPAPADTPYPGLLTLQVDATDLDRRIFRVRETIPVTPGPLTLHYPQWLPGNHAPTGVIGSLAGLKISAAGRPVAWQRDPVDVYAFRLDAPAGATALDIEFQFLSPVIARNGRVVVTPEMLNLQWNAVLVYPGGHADSRITVQPTLRLPEGWGFGTALDKAAQRGATVEFKPVTLETLIDSPVFAGKHLKRVDLDPEADAAGRTPVQMTVVADDPGDLEIGPEALAAHRALVTQADRLFGGRHFARYEFLLALTEQLGGVGLEHHQSNELTAKPGYFSDWAKPSVRRDDIAHEYVHSWNGKFRRPADLWTPGPQVPMQGSLLWVYEGQTQFWGNVLAARAGLVPLADALDGIAGDVAWVASEAGRQWRPLQDTTADNVMVPEAQDLPWSDWRRSASSYYVEGELIWLEADTLIRETSKGTRSLDDFARAFFGVEPGRIAPLRYGFDEVVAALDRVQPHDWAGFLRSRLDARARAPHDALARAGWKLAWSEQPSPTDKAAAAAFKSDDFGHSLGLQVGKGGALRSVRWGGPAFEAGLSAATKLIAVNGYAYSTERLQAAITAAKGGTAPIALLVQDGDLYKTVSIAYTGGLRYPKLERIPGTEDRLTPLLSARP
ncbi:MAG: peptidase M61 [Burkholderiales bacterium]